MNERFEFGSVEELVYVRLGFMKRGFDRVSGDGGIGNVKVD